MNIYLETFARNFLKLNLIKCTDPEQYLFKKMYDKLHGLTSDINMVIDDMPVEKLDHAMTQVAKTLEKRGESVSSYPG